MSTGKITPKNPEFLTAEEKEAVGFRSLPRSSEETPTNRERANRTPRFRDIAKAIKAERRIIVAYIKLQPHALNLVGNAEAVLNKIADDISNGAHYDVPNT
jgi:hypothetical protein